MVSSDNQEKNAYERVNVTQFPVLHDIITSTAATVGEEGRVPDDDMHLEKYPPKVTKALYEAIHTGRYLPCNCLEKNQEVVLVEEYRCALLLDLQLDRPRNESHWCFDSIARPTEHADWWTAVQFQFPRQHSLKVAFAVPGTPDPAYSDDRSFTKLDDFCHLFKGTTRYAGIPVKIEGEAPSHKVYTDLKYLVDVRLFDDDQEPIRLATALTNGCLSAKDQIYMAFVLAKACWQYYESEWMKAKWDLDTICLPPISPADTVKHAPPLALYIQKAESGGDALPEFIPKVTNSSDNIHPFPYILRLGVLLVLLCSRDPESTISSLKGLTKRSDISLFCYRAIENRREMWPSLDIGPKYKDVYKSIVKQCFGSPQSLTPLFSDGTLDAAGRRSILKDKVVLPLYCLLRDMEDAKTNAYEGLSLSGTQPNLYGHVGALNASKDVSLASQIWINNLKRSYLQSHLLDTIHDQRLQRPKIALIDTGFDPESKFITPKQKKRLRDARQGYNWRDFWKADSMPIDEHGHGTSMLSLLMDVAPFADVCVARIAAKNEDLKMDPPRTGCNLAKAIHWAVEVQHADVIVMALGWDKEPYSQTIPVVSNAITEMLTKSNQKVLFFAAASNSGSARDDMFPANLPNVFSIRGTNADGVHRDYNASLPEDGETTFGTLGEGVPVACRGQIYNIVGMDGASPATAVAAGLAAIVTAYMIVHDQGNLWTKIRTPQGFKKFLLDNMKRSASQKRFFTLEGFYDKRDQKAFRVALERAS
ncbi:hypothetical protein IG631_02549 [Alternaria alternata]|nr:hypothetical protein IG631_02549 [Alternaria alternata]